MKRRKLAAVVLAAAMLVQQTQMPAFAQELVV